MHLIINVNCNFYCSDNAVLIPLFHLVYTVLSSRVRKLRQRTYGTHFASMLQFRSFIIIARKHAYACSARYCCGKSVCLSVRLSITRWYCIQMNAHIVKLFPPCGWDMILVFWPQTTLQNSKGISLSRGVTYTGLGENLQFSSEIAIYLGNSTT